MTLATPPMLLVIDDQENLARFCRRMLGAEFRFHLVRDATSAREYLDSGGTVDGIILDRDFSHADRGRLLGPTAEVRREGLFILRWLRQFRPDLPIVMVTGHRDHLAALEAAELRTDYLAWDDVAANPKILESRLRKAFAPLGKETGAILNIFGSLGVIGKSPSFVTMLGRLYKAIHGNSPVFILGETGSGKDLLASAVHRLSHGQDRPFVDVNIASLNPSLFESELFGHKRGSFTGASESRVGKLRLAHKGTLFLNEIADLSLDAQAKLLSAIEQKVVYPVGDDRSQPAEFRLISATSRNLRGLSMQGLFRQDLYYRLAWNTVEIPPLRERKEDLSLLVGYFLQQVRARTGKVLSVTDEAMRFLESLPWPGNVRQLESAIITACSVSDYIITPMDLRDIIRLQESGSAHGAALLEVPTKPDQQLGPASSRDSAEAEALVFGNLDYREVTGRYFRYLMRRGQGRIADVANEAGISKATAYTWKDRFEG